MANRANDTSNMFLIMNHYDESTTLPSELRAKGFEVQVYLTAREFLIDRRNHSGGVVVAECPLIDMAGTELVERLREESEMFSVVLMVGNHHMPRVLPSMARLIVKPVTADKIQNAVKRTHIPEVFSPTELRKLFGRITPKEFEVIVQVASGKSSRQIAETLNISVKATDGHRARIKAKLRTKNSGELVRKWTAWRALQ